MKEELVQKLNEMRNQVKPADEGAIAKAAARLDDIAKPLDGLGVFEEWIKKAAGATRSADIAVDPAQLLVFCADNGIVEEGVTQSESYITGNIARNIATGKSAVGCLAADAGCAVRVIDLGMTDDARDAVFDILLRGDEEAEIGVVDRNVKKGTENFLKAPAMSEEELISAIECGFTEAVKAIDKGAKIILVGEAGIGNTTTSATIASALLGIAPEETVGRGSGLSDKGLSKKIEVVRYGLVKNGFEVDVKAEGDEEVLRLLTNLGGLDIAGIIGAILGAASRNVPIVTDGVISSAAALAAYRLCPDVAAYILPGHCGKEPAVSMIHEEMGMSAPIHADLSLGEGTGAVMAYMLFKMVLTAYRDAATFEDIHMDGYERL